MKGLRFLSLAVLGASLFAPLSDSASQEPANPEELRKLCATILCREPGLVRLTLDGGKPFETKFDWPRPITQNGWISIYPGETIFVEAAAKGDRLANFRAVKTNDHPEKTMTFKFSQEAGSPAMILIVTNPLARSLKYHAGMMLPTSDKLLKTSSCPVLGGGRKAFESWPNAIFQLVLFDFQLLDEGTTQMSCEF
jgi:hypothetical protein